MHTAAPVRAVMAVLSKHQIFSIGPCASLIIDFQPAPFSGGRVAVLFGSERPHRSASPSLLNQWLAYLSSSAVN